jgi:hypothetical protein
MKQRSIQEGIGWDGISGLNLGIYEAFLRITQPREIGCFIRVLNPHVTLYQMRAIKMSVKVESNSWTIESQGGSLGPLTSYALALWAVQGLLYPNDILVHNSHSRARAGALEILHPFIRNNGHLNRAKVWTFASGKGGVGKSL